MVNNLELIKPLLIFESSDTYYFCQILMRSKENDIPAKNSQNIKNYNIKSIEHLEKKMPEIIGLCDYFKARAYLRLTPRSFKSTALHHLKQVAQLIADENYQHFARFYLSSSGSTSSDTQKRWLIDIDENLNSDYLSEMKTFINSLPPEGSKILAEIPSKSGLHLITKPFRSDWFEDSYPHIDVHKDNPVNLYIPDLNN